VPFYFAWCDAGQPFDDSVLREDEIIFAFDLAHQEGQIPTLSVDVVNPHIGLLAPGRAQWAWLSYSDDIGVYPLFYGRLVALPTNLLGEVVTLQFLSRPDDFLAQKQAIANELAVEPWFDPIWISSDKLGDPTIGPDPDTVLETYTMAWHVDRTTLAVSVSDIIFGEDGTEEFGPEESFYDSVSISFAQSPQTQVVCDCTVQWTQAFTGSIALPDVSLSAWNGDQIVNDWPNIGDNLGAGWSVVFSAITNFSDQFGGSNPITINVGGDTSSSSGGSQDSGTTSPPPDLTPPTSTLPQETGTFGGLKSSLPTTSLAKSITVSYQNQAKTHNNGDVMSVNESIQYDDEGKLGGKIVSQSASITIGNVETGTAAAASYNYSYTRTVGEPQVAPPTAPSTPVTTIIIDGNPTQQGGGPITIPSLFGQLTLQYDLSFGRTETITFIMNSDVQPIVLLSPDDTSNQITLSMNGSDLGLLLDNGQTTAPIGDPGLSAFFPTDRGQQALQYPMLVARANLAQSARAAKINFDCTFERAINLSCRKNALLLDSRLPGGQVLGKITEYHLKVDGDKGQLIGNVQIESTIGNDTELAAQEGFPTYVDGGVEGYQYYAGATALLPYGDAEIQIPTTELVENQMSLPLSFDDAVMVFQIHEGTPVETVDAGGAASADPTWLEIVLTPVTGQDYTTTYDLGTSTLVLPMMIDLAAPSA
jgi:hypothetical protein